MTARRSLPGAVVLALAVGLGPGAFAQEQPDRPRPFVGAPLAVSLDDLAIEDDLGAFTATWDASDPEPGVTVFGLRLEAEAPAAVPRFSIRWSVPALDVASFWNTNLSNDKVNYYRNRIQSRATSGAPVTCLLNSADVNRLTVAVSEALDPVRLNTWMREEDGRLHFSVTLFEERAPATDGYAVSLRLDARPVAYHRALADVSAWWERLGPEPPAPVPDAARRPMVSTWYSFHQDLDPDAVLAELELAAGLGYGAVIVDDGWQTLDSSRGYAYTGDWKPERIPDMRGFVDAVHALGMDFLLWYSVPLVGEQAANFERFEERMLYHWESQGAWVLDPRYPDVRAFLIDTYVRALREWDLDGFKLDFLGFFHAVDDTVLEATDGRDMAGVNAAVDRLMTDVMTALRAEKPDVLVEFRQPYNGPRMRTYGNMFRAVDCPGNAIANRAETTDIRLVAGNTAVHSDMLMWHPKDPVESAALQLLNVLFAVPQISVRLTTLPEEHLAMVRFWTGWWRAQRDVLLDGEFTPVSPASTYPVLIASVPGRVIAGVYADALVVLGREQLADLTELHLVNGKGTPALAVDLPVALGDVVVTTRDVQGRVVQRRTRRLDRGVQGFTAPPAGLVSVSTASDRAADAIR